MYHEHGDTPLCTPEQAHEWTDGSALCAAGVQFPDVTVNGKTLHPGQADNPDDIRTLIESLTYTPRY
jgi:hypothetical protein